MSLRPSVLIVDDDQTIRKLISTILGRRDLDFSTASDGVEALAMLDKRRYDVMLLDLMMPRMDGYEVLEKLRGRVNRPFVILVSARAITCRSVSTRPWSTPSSASRSTSSSSLISSSPRLPAPPMRCSTTTPQPFLCASRSWCRWPSRARWTFRPTTRQGRTTPDVS